MVRGLAAVILAATLCACTTSRYENALSAEDRTNMTAATQAALEYERTGKGRVWDNPRTDHRGTVTPLRTWINDDDRPCRDYQALVTIDDTTRASYGKACRDPSGFWVDIRSPSAFAPPGHAYDRRTRLHSGIGFGHHFGHHSFGLHHGYIFRPYPWYAAQYGPYWPHYAY